MIPIKRLLPAGAVIAMATGCGTSDALLSPTLAESVSASTTTAPVPTTEVTTPAASSTAVTTDAPPTTADSAATEAPANHSNDAELTNILNALFVRSNQLYKDPANADVSSLCISGSECEARLNAQLGDMTSRGEHLEGTEPSTIETIVTARDLALEQGSPFDTGQAFEIEFVIFAPKELGRIVDGNGNTVEELILADDAPLTDTRTIVRASTDEDLPWRFAD